MVGDVRQGRAMAFAMLIIGMISLVGITAFEEIHHGTVPTAVGTSLEGKDTRYGVPDSAAFANATTLTSTGAIDSWHDSFTSLAGGTILLNMMYREVAPGAIAPRIYPILTPALLP